MCGFFGVVTDDQRIDWQHVVQAGLRTISHRGPDQTGVWAGGRNTRIVLGHVRLSIIDLAGGQQPMINAGAGLVLAYNGEIYNYQELRAELQDRGYEFAERSDTEVVLRAYEEWGERCVERFRGMFALALWDERLRQLFLARDPFGKKPLFWAQTGHTLVFGSEIKALLCNPLLRRQADETALRDYFSYRYVPGPRTLFEDIRKLMPGSYAIWREGNLEEKSYFLPPDGSPAGAMQSLRVAEPVQGFLERLRDAVRVRMVSDVPFGAFLSGGIDSSAVVALMAKESSLPVSTFSVGFAESGFSELSFARIVAKQYATDHHELIISERDVMDELPALIRYRDAPVAEPSDIPIHLLSREARKSVKMVLTGEGSDEVLGGYPKHLLERWAPFYQALPGALRHRVIEPSVRSLPYRFHRLKTALLSLGINDRRERLPRWFGVLSAEERKHLLVPDLLRASAGEDRAFNTSPENSGLRNILFFDQVSWLPDNLLERGDRMTMAASLEARMPFLDSELARYVSGLADRYRVRGNKTKWILRKAMEGVLPKEILARRKNGFRVPVNKWFQGPMRDYLHDHLLGADSRTVDFYQPGALERTLREHVTGRQNHEKLLWSLLNLELWMRLYLTPPSEGASGSGMRYSQARPLR